MRQRVQLDWHASRYDDRDRYIGHNGGDEG